MTKKRSAKTSEGRGVWTSFGGSEGGGPSNVQVMKKYTLVTSAANGGKVTKKKKMKAKGFSSDKAKINLK